MNIDGYPEKEEFDLLASLDYRNEEASFQTLCNLFNSCGSGCGRLERSLDELNKEVLTLELHTGGWSGCESMIEYLQSNTILFWTMYWYSETRGGHFIFKGR